MNAPAVAAAVLLTAASAAAESILFRTAELGPTGVTLAELASQVVPGTNVTSRIFIGARFELTTPVVTSRIGGHFVSVGVDGGFFGAIVALDGPDDLPDSGDLSTPDVLGVTLLDFPAPSAEVFGDLELSLSPGWYGVVFGSGLFGATGRGGSVDNGDAIGVGSLIGRGTSPAWASTEPASLGQSLRVDGEVVPEPAAATLLMVCVAVFQLSKHCRSCVNE